MENCPFCQTQHPQDRLTRKRCRQKMWARKNRILNPEKTREYRRLLRLRNPEKEQEARLREQARRIEKYNFNKSFWHRSSAQNILSHHRVTGHQTPHILYCPKCVRHFSFWGPILDTFCQRCGEIHVQMIQKSPEKFCKVYTKPPLQKLSTPTTP